MSKVDLAIVDSVRERLVRILEEEGRVQEQRAECGGGGGGAASSYMHFIKLSIKEGTGVEELRQEVMRVLGEVWVILDAMSKRPCGVNKKVGTCVILRATRIIVYCVMICPFIKIHAIRCVDECQNGSPG